MMPKYIIPTILIGVLLLFAPETLKVVGLGLVVIGIFLYYQYYMKDMGYL